MRSCITASLRRRKGGKQDRIGNETGFWGNVQDEGKHVKILHVICIVCVGGDKG